MFRPLPADGFRTSGFVSSHPACRATIPSNRLTRLTLPFGDLRVLLGSADGPARLVRTLQMQPACILRAIPGGACQDDRPEPRLPFGKEALSPSGTAHASRFGGGEIPVYCYNDELFGFNPQD